MSHTRFMIVALAVALASPPGVRADDKPTCQPWPNCQLDHLTIKPGAPNIGIRPIAKPTDTGSGMELLIDRDSLRMPKSTNEGTSNAVK